MSQIILKSRNNNMTAVTITLLFFMGLFLLAAESRADLTTIQWFDCKEQTVSTDDPYMIAVTNVLGSIADTAPYQPNYQLSTSSTVQGITAFGNGNCDPNIVSDSDECLECLTACVGMFFPLCGPAIGADIQLTACYVTYH